MLNQNMLGALKVLTQRLEKTNWRVIGSVALALQGINLEPRDIDIETDEKEAVEIIMLLKDDETRPAELKVSGNYESKIWTFGIAGVEVEVIANLRVKHGDNWVASPNLAAPKVVEVGEMKIPLSPLEEQLEMYENLKRKERVQKIREALKEQSSAT